MGCGVEGHDAGDDDHAGAEFAVAASTAELLDENSRVCGDVNRSSRKRTLRVLARLLADAAGRLDQDPGARPASMTLPYAVRDSASSMASVARSSGTRAAIGAMGTPPGSRDDRRAFHR